MKCDNYIVAELEENQIIYVVQIWQCANFSLLISNTRHCMWVFV